MGRTEKGDRAEKTERAERAGKSEGDRVGKSGERRSGHGGSGEGEKGKRSEGGDKSERKGADDSKRGRKPRDETKRVGEQSAGVKESGRGDEAGGSGEGGPKTSGSKRSGDRGDSDASPGGSGDEIARKRRRRRPISSTDEETDGAYTSGTDGARAAPSLATTASETVTTDTPTLPGATRKAACVPGASSLGSLFRFGLSGPSAISMGVSDAQMRRASVACLMSRIRVTLAQMELLVLHLSDCPSSNWKEIVDCGERIAAEQLASEHVRVAADLLSASTPSTSH